MADGGHNELENIADPVLVRSAYILTQLKQPGPLNQDILDIFEQNGRTFGCKQCGKKNKEKYIIHVSGDATVARNLAKNEKAALICTGCKASFKKNIRV